MATNAIAAALEPTTFPVPTLNTPPIREAQSVSLRSRPNEIVAEEAERTPTSETTLASLNDAVEQLQATADLVNRGLRFNVDSTNNTVQVIILNEDTQEVLRKIPADEVVKLAQRLQEAIGLIFDKVA